HYIKTNNLSVIERAHFFENKSLEIAQHQWFIQVLGGCQDILAPLAICILIEIPPLFYEVIFKALGTCCFLDILYHSPIDDSNVMHFYSFLKRYNNGLRKAILT